MNVRRLVRLYNRARLSYLLVPLDTSHHAGDSELDRAVRMHEDQRKQARAVEDKRIRRIGEPWTLRRCELWNSVIFGLLSTQDALLESGARVATAAALSAP
jgi:hypothetical protein